ncbi:MAG: hypothetical protein JSS56_04830 [Proteobacteria bacterium]|nr:hypothetical protein [Pseudomonadota bacterium]
MNIHKEHPPESDDLLAPPEWSMEILQAQGQQIAVVKRKSKEMCRLSLCIPESDAEEARRLLADKARQWIRDYRSKRSSRGLPSSATATGPTRE